MFKCDDCWCENYNKNSAKCDLCINKESEEHKFDINRLLIKRTANIIQLDDKTKIKGQLR